MSVYVPWDMKDIQWPCSTGWHLPLDMEISWLINLWISIGAWDATGAVDFATKLHIPFAWYRDNGTSDVAYQWTRGLYWGCWVSWNYGRWFWMVSSSWTLGQSNGYRSDWRTIRPFKNTYAKPTESWTVIEWTLWSAGIFWDTVWWMITITDGSMGYTIADKNLWATTVWNSWDTLSVTNCWKYYQRWNNYWFAFSVSVTKSSSRVDASAYWPWNYYSSSTFLWVWYSDWSSVQNNNLWGGDTWVRPVEITNAYIGSTPIKRATIRPNGVEKQVRPSGWGWQPWANTVAYYKFDWNLNDSSGNNRNMSLYRGSVTYWTIWNNKYGHFDSSTWTNQVTIPLPWDFTFLMWVNPQYDYADTYPRAMVDMQYNSSSGCLRLFGTIHPWDWTYYHINTNERHLIVYSWTQSIGEAKFYCVDENYSESGITFTHITGDQKLKLNQIWDANNSNYTNNTYLSEIIIENKVWTDQEIQDYYNQTKANYGL